jgi:hypothetical protein
LCLLQRLKDWFDVYPGFGIETDWARKRGWGIRVCDAVFHGFFPMISGGHRKISISLQAKIEL